MRRLRNTAAFALTEVLMVCVICGILASVAVPTYIGYREEAKRSAARESLAVTAKLMARDRNTKFTFGADQNANETTLANQLSKDGDPIKFHPYANGSSPSTGPQDVSISVEDPEMATACARADTRSPSYFCVRIDLRSALRVADAGKPLSLNPLGAGTVYAADEHSVARAQSDSEEQARAMLPTRERPPVNTPGGSSGAPAASDPAITGIPRSGFTLTGVAPVMYSGAAQSTISYLWQRCDREGSHCVGTARTTLTYPLTNADVGYRMRLVASISNPLGNLTRSSTPTRVVTMGVPVNTGKPTITGAPFRGETLTGNRGTWSNLPDGFDYQWKRCDQLGANCVNIPGETSTTYTTTFADVDHTLIFEVQAYNDDGVQAADSDPTAPIALRLPANTALPTISGNPWRNELQTGSRGTWTNSPTSYAYQWQRCDLAGANCADIGGETASTYTTTLTDIDRTLRLRVTATNDDGSVSATSAPTARITPRVPVNVTPPTIDGSSTVGQNLRVASNGTWTNNPTSFAYQWQSCTSAAATSCSNITGATGNQYTVPSAGLYLRVFVTATNAEGSGTAGSATSRSTANAATYTITNAAYKDISNGWWTSPPWGNPTYPFVDSNNMGTYMYSPDAGVYQIHGIGPVSLAAGEKATSLQVSYYWYNDRCYEPVQSTMLLQIGWTVLGARYHGCGSGWDSVTYNGDVLPADVNDLWFAVYSNAGSYYYCPGNNIQVPGSCAPAPTSFNRYDSVSLRYTVVRTAP